MSHQPRKRFGQNFLQDKSVIENIVAAARPETGQHWLEIGPGLGALTLPLLQAGVKLDVVELDRDLVERLRQKFGKEPRLTIHSADALTFDFVKLVIPGNKLRVIGNLPYNISTPLLFHLLENCSCIADMHFMLQKEVVERICAVPGCKQYGRLSVMLQYYCEADHIFDVLPTSFFPKPQVMSAIVCLKPHAKTPVEIGNIGIFKQILSEAFSQRRKTLRNSLKNWVDEQQMLELDINPGLRAEALSLEQFAKLSLLASTRS
jgi:16S rRNA (adenine1518-N6/adenine1519-N6)-dimethyltransferase